jgi:hypothetical protein
VKKKSKKSWSRTEKLTAVVLVVAVITLCSAFFIPEVRRFFGVEKRIATNRFLMARNIVENGQTIQASGSPSDVTVVNNEARNGAVMFDVRQLGAGCFDNDTTVGNAGMLRADKVDSLSVTNSVAYSDPNARPAAVGNGRSFNYGEWLDFLDTANRKDEKALASIEELRYRLETQWRELPADQQRKNKNELETVLGKLTAGGWDTNAFYRNHAPNFVRMPCV